MTDSSATLTGEHLAAEISAHGAQLVRLRDRDGRDLLWDADLSVWAWHAPLLFPIVGRLKDDRLAVDGRTYVMKQHGIARGSVFELVTADESQCLFRLVANEKTREAYPFDFVLEILYRLDGPRLALSARVESAGSTDMPASFGFHPAFRWPLPYGRPRDEHRILFQQDEPDGLRQLADGLLKEERIPSPVEGRVLPLSDQLFADDALVFDRVRSQEVLYGAEGTPQIKVGFPDMPHLGIWSKPGAGYVCIEPWHGHASPEGFAGELRDKPGMQLIAPGGEAHFAMDITLISVGET